ncbi:hypothetical protein ABZS93_26195 [Streptomyces sp900116325]|uniref:hypothetical protein n=1 Tax=Streptomyces sp. 900116325 TaxID=3154295 RepID=UPI0033BD7094
MVAEVAPAELPLVAGLDGFDDATAVRRLGSRGRRGETLGFGLGEVAALVTPVVWLTLDQVAQRIVGNAVDSGASRARSALRKLFRRPAEPVSLPPLTREQLADVRKSVLEVAAERGLEQQQASSISDAVVARLALAGPEESRHQPIGPELTTPDSPAAAAADGEA